MVQIYFVSPYKPIMCGIADYTEYVIKELPDSNRGVLSFDLKKLNSPLLLNRTENNDCVWYGIPGAQNISASTLIKGLQALQYQPDKSVLWFQHEFGIWPDSKRLINTLKKIDIPKIITFHTIHFQSKETVSGMRKKQYKFLKEILPLVDAVTVFSRGAFEAVVFAFPDYADKVHILKHGIHLYPGINQMSTAEAKNRFKDYIIHDLVADMGVKKRLLRERVFHEDGPIVIGQAGFLGKHKGSETLFSFRDKLQNTVPKQRIVGVRMGGLRDKRQKQHVEKLRASHSGKNKFIVEAWLPPNILPLAQRAFDINFYWPEHCTQSGVAAHALGAGALMVGRDLEGFGEVLKQAGGIVGQDLSSVTERSRELLLQPALKEEMAETSLSYAQTYSWKKQAKKHLQIAAKALSAYKPLKKQRVFDQVLSAFKNGL
ncbi:MAG: hypothetical protein WC958_04960 [Dehalococcoidales bacterium]